jgi:hypothetical protein
VAAGTVLETVHVPTQRINRLQFTPDGKRVLLSDSGNGDLVVMDTVSRKETSGERSAKTAKTS